MRKILCLLMFLALFLILASCNKDEISDDPSIEPPKHVHSFGEWTVKTPSSCTEQGTEERICVCGIAENRPIDLVGHSFGAWVVKTSPSCTNQGTEERTCACGVAENRSIDPVGHSFGKWTVKTPSSCTEQGTEERTCACGVAENRSIDPVGHSFGEWTVKTPSSCTEQGTEERICACGVVENRSIDPVGHSFGEWTVKTPSSCTEQGTEERICACGVVENRLIDLVEHSFGEWTVKTPSSCAEQGTEERTCACGVAENRVIDPVGHSFGDWEIVTPANCIEAGTMQRACRNCPHTESAPTESIHPLGEAEPFIEATCYQKGYTIYRCTACTYYEVQEIIQTHEFTKIVELYPATCVARGGIERYCSKCEKTLFDYTDPLGHDEYDWTRVENRSNSVVLVEHKGCRRCDVADDERKGFVKNTFSADETVLKITNPYSPLNPAFNYTQFIENVAGSCYSKKGYYQAYLSDDGGLAVLVLLNTNNKIVCSDVRTDLGYANDMTYNPKTNQLLVLNEKKVVIFDGDTLAYVRTVNMPRVGDAIAYVESTDRYAIMVDDRVEYYNANFGYACSFRIFNFGNGPYQICADDNYVYVMFVSNYGVGRDVHVYLHNGKALGEVSIQKTSNSNPTGISIVDGYLYVSIPDGSLRTLLKKIE